jgi:HlyD family secretion protein
MQNGQDVRRSGGPAQHPAGESRGDGLGPQEAALILELQRLRQAFDSEIANGPRAAKANSSASNASGRRIAPHTSRPKRRKKGRMSRAINVCLQQFGLKAAAPAKQGVETPDRTFAVPLRQSPSIAPGPGIPWPDRSHEPVGPENRQVRQPGQGAETPVRGLIRRVSAGLMTGTAFLLARNASDRANDAADVNLMAGAGRSFETELRTGLRILLVAALLGGGWLALVPLAGAVVVPGNLVVQSSVKAIQHPTGGVVAEIKATNGMGVAAGDLLLRLDATQVQASLQMVRKQLDEVGARIARLTAERDGLDQPQTPAALLARAAEDNVRSLLASETSLFKARFEGRRSQKDLLQSRIVQLTEGIAGLEAQVSSKAKQLDLISGELVGVQELYDKRLVPLARLTSLQRETARIEGERGQLTSSIAETKSKIGEAQLQIARLDQDFRTDVVKELGEAQAKEAELVERGVAAQDQLDRIELRAPTSGVIHQLAAHTIGGVIRAGDTIMEIVPDTDDLLIEARLQPKDIDQVRSGQTAFVRFSSFNQRVTPQLTGTVSFVSADTSRDQQTNTSYFTVRVVLPDEERRRLGGLQLIPGMPAEVFMQTGSRTMMNYLLKPIIEQMNRAFVEQ